MLETLQFEHPSALWLLLGVPVLIAVAVFSRRRISRMRLWMATVVRIVLLLLLVTALSELTYGHLVDDLGVVFVVDRSASVSDQGRRSATGFIQESMKRMEEGDRAAVVVFGADAYVEREMSPENSFHGVETDPGVHHTDIAAGLRLAQATLPSDAAHRVVLLSDGEETRGDAAGQVLLGSGDELSVVPLGRGALPEVVLESLIVPDKVDRGSGFEIRVVARSVRSGNATLRLYRNEHYLGDIPVELSGGRADVFTFRQVAEEPGLLRYRALLEVDDGDLDALPQNNEVMATVQVSGSPKVLYVEGIPRWEYRYLRAVLQRDRRLDVKFLMTEGDPDLPKYSGQYVARFPEAAAEALKYDLIILGDVAADCLKPADQARIDELVRRRGGSLLMLAGRRHAPMSYHGTPIGDLLPVRIGRQGIEQLADDVYPVVTGEGYVSACMSLQQPAAVNDRLWSLVRPLYRAPYLDGAKQGATVLAELSDTARRDGKAYPLIAWHRVGSGKCMFVGTDQLWRLRFLQGDRYHARFWGQASQFLALSRLLGANKRIRIETDRNVYPGGEPVHVYANVLSDAFEPVDRTEYTVYVARRDTPANPAPVTLRAVEGSPGLFQGYLTPDKDGHYVVTPPAPDKPVANQAEFKVETVALERRQPAMQETTLKMLGEMSGGRYFSIRQLPDLPKALARPDRFTVVRMEKELWDLPGLFVLLVLLAGAEWYFRRRYNLA